jgi:hypothetical protein
MVDGERLENIGIAPMIEVQADPQINLRFVVLSQDQYRAAYLDRCV